MKTRLLLISTLVVVLVNPAVTTGQVESDCAFEYGTWSEMEPVPSNIYAHSATMLNGKIYLFGGIYEIADLDNDTLYYLDEILEYDPIEDRWDTAGIFPISRLFVASCAMNDRIYILQGYHRNLGNDEPTFYYSLESYEPVTNTWTTLANYPENLFFSQLCAWNGNLYACGGTETTSANVVNSLYRYDPGSDTWTKLSGMNQPRSAHMMEVVDGKIYVFGGTDTWDNAIAMHSAEVYDPATDTWSELDDMPHNTMFGGSAASDGQIFLFGGRRLFNTSHTTYDIIQKYNTCTGRYMVEELGVLPSPRLRFQSVLIGRSIYHLGGSQSHVIQYDTLGANNNWRWELRDILLDSIIPEQILETDQVEIQIELSTYFRHINEETIEYLACVSDTAVVTASINGSMLEIEGRSSGATDIQILAASGEDRMGNSFTVTVGNVGQARDHAMIRKLEIYPNPSLGQVQIQFTLNNYSEVCIELYDLVGKRVKKVLNASKNPGEYKISEDLSGLASGYYLLMLTTEREKVTKGIVIQ